MQKNGESYGNWIGEMIMFSSGEKINQENTVKTVPVKYLLLVFLTILLPGIGEIVFGFHGSIVELGYFVPAFVLSYFLGLKGGVLAVALIPLSAFVSRIVLWWLGREEFVFSWQEDFISLGGSMIFSLMVGYFAEKMLVRNKMLEMANAKLQMLAMTDELTRLYNHRYFQMRLEEEIQRSQRQKNPLSLIMLDVDFFKQYNDTHGHPAGDYLLQLLGGIFRDKVRIMDTVARYGGEEFAIILYDTMGEQAVLVADRIRQAVQDYPFPGRETQPGGRITVSVGIASFPINAANRKELIQRADQAMYQAKKETRNTVQLSFSISEDNLTCV
ncbi:MAG: GGDEF domain-containing protein [Thermincolia bacterium]